MEVLIMLFCSLLPAALLVAFVIYRDRRNPEPAGKIIKGLFFGVLTAIVTLIVGQLWGLLPRITGWGWLYELPFVRGVVTAFYDAAIPEESIKLLFLWLLLRKNAEFEESMDGIVYAVCVGMGFAGLENVLYVFGTDGPWQGTAITRCLFAVPGHYIFAVLMGFFYSLVHFHPVKFGKYKSLIWIAPVVAHGIYDTICFVGAEHVVLSILVYIPLIIFCVFMHRWSLKFIGNLEAIDEDKRDQQRFMDAMRGQN